MAFCCRLMSFSSAAPAPERSEAGTGSAGDVRGAVSMLQSTLTIPVAGADAGRARLHSCKSCEKAGGKAAPGAAWRRAKISLHGVSGAANPARPWAMGSREPLAAKAGGPPARMPHRPNRHDVAAVTPHETDRGASPPTTAQPHE